MPYARLGQVDCTDPTEVGNAACGASDGSNSGIDWTQVITTGEQVIGQVVKPGITFPTRYPTYLPTSSAFSSLQSNPLLLLALVGGAIYLAKRGR